MTNKQILAQPKVELHRHLEGSLSVNTLLTFAKEFNYKLPANSPEELAKHAVITKQEKSLKAVLDRFAIAQSCFVNYDAIEFLTYLAVKEAGLDNIKVLELRYSPEFIAEGHHHDHDLVLGAILNGIEKAKTEVEIQVGLLIISTREFGREAAHRTIDFAISRKEDIVGVDLAGDESSVPPGNFIAAFEKARNAGLNVTIHAGEEQGAEYVKAAIEDLGATRIGHGIRIVDDHALLNACIKNKIHFEQNPTSNYITNCTPVFEQHPSLPLLKKGLSVGINTDDPGIFGISLSQEYERCVNRLGFTQDDIRQVNLNALESSFMEPDIKNNLRTIWQ